MHRSALGFGEQFEERAWAIEGCGHLSRRLEADLLRAGEHVVRVPPRLMGLARGSGRDRGKSDPIDALAVARAALREDQLPVARLDDEERLLRLLLDHREDLVAERTRNQNRLRWHLHELGLGGDIAPGALDRFCVLHRPGAELAGRDELVAALATELVARIEADTRRINELERTVTERVRPLARHLLALHGCGPLTAAKILGETADVTRFRSKAAFARHNGTAPVPVWSANDVGHRLNWGGNRQINAALHRIAVTQLRGGLGRDCLEHRMKQGVTKTEAIRALPRRLSDEVFGRLLADAQSQHSAAAACVAAAA